MIDYYEILEVSPKASLEVIRAAYKVLLHRYNVEHDSEDQSEIQELQNLNLAYDVLSDPDKREAYDHELNKIRKALNGSASPHNPDRLAGDNVVQIGQADSNQLISKANKKGQTSKNASLLSRLNWNRWGWIVSILAVVIVLISMVRPDPEKALSGQAAVKSHVESKELGTGLKKGEAEKQKTDPVENKGK